MDFNAYQQEAYRTALPRCRNLTYMVLGLTNEAGEAAGKFKKALRGDRSLDDTKKILAEELGDVLWYAAGIATQIGYDLGTIADMNIQKLHSREMRGTLQGDGDAR